MQSSPPPFKEPPQTTPREPRQSYKCSFPGCSAKRSYHKCSLCGGPFCPVHRGNSSGFGQFQIGDPPREVRIPKWAYEDLICTLCSRVPLRMGKEEFTRDWIFWAHWITDPDLAREIWNVLVTSKDPLGSAKENYWNTFFLAGKNLGVSSWRELEEKENGTH